MKEKYIREREQYILALEAKVSRLEQEIEEESVYDLMAGLANIEAQLQQLNERMAIMEEYVKS